MLVEEKKIFLRGPFICSSGYSVHARQIARWAFSKENVKVYTQLLNWGNTPWILDETRCDGLIGKLIKSSTENPPQGTDLAIQVQLPNEWIRYASVKHHVGITAGVETTVCNPAWATSISNMDLVVVPSQHVKGIFDALPTPHNQSNVRVIPESFIDAIKTPNKNVKLEVDTNFNILVFGQITGGNADLDRKNTFYTLKWLCEAFKDDKDVGIIIKTNVGRNTAIDRHQTSNLLIAALNECRHGPYPKIHLLHGDMTDEDVAGLYVHPKIKVFVSLSKGESWGLPMLEAAASGLPIVTVPWSGHLDYLSLGKYIKIDYILKEIPKERVDPNIFMPNAKWAIANELDFKNRIKKLRKDYEVPLQWATELKNKILEQYNFENISKQYDEMFLDYLK